MPVNVSKPVCALIVTVLFVLAPARGTGTMKPLSDRELSRVNGREGVAFILNDWRIDAGNLGLTLTEGTSGSGRLSLRSLRVYDPDGIDNPDFDGDGNTAEHNDPGPFGSDAGNRLSSGSFGDPFQINASSSGSGILALTWPDNNGNSPPNLNFEAADIQFATWMNDNFLLRATVGNALWAGGTKLAAEIRPDGGLGLGIAMQLNGDVWVTAEEVSEGPYERGLFLEGVYGASNYSCSPPTVQESCFSGALTWATLSNDRPLNIDFDTNGNEFVIERCATWTAGCTNQANAGTIGIQNLTFSGETTSFSEVSLGSSVIDNIQIRHFEIRAPL